MVLSDGLYKFSACLVTTTLTPQIESGAIQKNTVFNLIEFVVHDARQRRPPGQVIVVMGIDENNIQNWESVIGNPQELESQQPNQSVGYSGQQQAGNLQDGNLASMSTTNNSFGNQPGMNPMPNRNATAYNNSLSNLGQQAAGQQFQYQQQQQQPPSSYIPNANYASVGAGAISRNTAAPRIVPINYLNPYMNKWVIKGRVTGKSQIITFNNSRGDGQLFGFEFVDNSGDIRVTAFNAECQKFFDLIVDGKVYTISKGSLKPKRPQYNSTSHAFELYLGRESEVIPTEDNQLPAARYNFRKIGDIQSMEVGAVIDVIGVVDKCEPVIQLNKKDGTPLTKRSVIIRDETQKSVELTFWNKFSTEPGNQLEQLLSAGSLPVVVACKACRVGDFNGKTLSTVGNSTVSLNPSIPEASQLQNWYAAGGNNAAVVPLSDVRSSGSRKDRRVTVKIINDENLGTNGQADFFAVQGYISSVHSQSFTYPSCPLQFNGRDCQKKLVCDDGVTWRCQRCMQNVPSPRYRWLLNITLVDATGELAPVTIFGEAGDSVMKMSADEYETKVADGSFGENQASHSTNFREMIFKIKAAQDTYNDETRIKYTVMRADEISFIEENRGVIESINKMRSGEPIMSAQPRMGGGAGRGVNTNNAGIYGQSMQGFGMGQMQQQQQFGHGGGMGMRTPGNAMNQGFGGFENQY